MNSINQVLDQLADLYLTGPMDGHGHSPGTDSARGIRGLAARQGATRRIPPSRSLVAQTPANGEPLKLVNIENETHLKRMEQAVLSSMENPLPLAVRYPGDRQIRLLVDQRGRVHLWRDRLDRDIHTDVVNLFTARFWVSENIELIALAQRGCPFDLDADPVLHIFTCNETNAEMLGSVLGPFIKVHIQSTPKATGSNDAIPA